MKILLTFFVLLFSSMLLISCEDEEWLCKIDGDSMYSLSISGKFGSADKGCSCQQIRSFELNTFGSVDEEALKKDFGC